MNYSSFFLFKGAAWTLGAFGVGQLFRFVTNIALARLLAPELLGIMVIVNSIRTGVDLITDIGIGQNIVQNPKAENPNFYNTAWTLRLIRSVLLWFLCLSVASPLARFYDIPILATVLPVAGLFFVIGAMGSVAVPLLQRRMRFIRLNCFEAAQEIISSAVHVLLAYVSPTIWALVLGGLLSTAARSIGSYLVLPGLRPSFLMARGYIWEIFSFGKWIFVSSIIYFLAMNFDRLYIGKVAALELLGVYSIARTLSELVGTLAHRLSNYLVFPLIASFQSLPRDQLRSALYTKRLAFLIFSGFSLAVLVTIGDVVITTLYDNRYAAAGWMLPILLLGTWFSVLASMNESTLLGFGKPTYGAMANGLKLLWMIAGIPVAFTQFGVLGVVIVVAAADIWRCGPTAVGLVRERFSFVGQDIVGTLIVVVLVTLCEGLRSSIGLGTSLDGLPISELR